MEKNLELQLKKAIQDYQLQGDQEHSQLASQERKEFLKRFPREDWQTMQLGEYALSRENFKDSYSYWVERGTPHVPEAWIDASKKDKQDGEIGIVGYEIPFNRHFYVYQPPRDLVEIDADLDKVSAEIMDLPREVHS